MFSSEHQREMRETLTTDPNPVLPPTSDDISLTSVFPMPVGLDQTVTPSTELALDRTCFYVFYLVFLSLMHSYFHFI